jgi:hypothetical protein
MDSKDKSIGESPSGAMDATKWVTRWPNVSGPLHSSCRLKNIGSGRPML